MGAGASINQQDIDTLHDSSKEVHQENVNSKVEGGAIDVIHSFTAPNIFSKKCEIGLLDLIILLTAENHESEHVNLKKSLSDAGNVVTNEKENHRRSSSMEAAKILQDIFSEIALKAEAGRINSSCKINLLNLLSYFREVESNEDIPKKSTPFSLHNDLKSCPHLKHVTKEVIIQAFNYTTQSGLFSTSSEEKVLKKKHSDHSHHHHLHHEHSHHRKKSVHLDAIDSVSSKVKASSESDTITPNNASFSFEQFRLYLTCLYLFSLLWDWFTTLIHQDQITHHPSNPNLAHYDRISIHELTTMKDQVIALIYRFKSPRHQSEIQSFTEEMWQEILTKMDRDNNSFVTFEEFIFFMVSNVRKPEKYMLRRSHKNNNIEDNTQADILSDDSDEEDHHQSEQDAALAFESAAQAVLEAQKREHDQKLALKVAELRNKLHPQEHPIAT